MQKYETILIQLEKINRKIQSDPKAKLLTHLLSMVRLETANLAEIEKETMKDFGFTESDINRDIWYSSPIKVSRVNARPKDYCIESLEAN